MATIDFPSNPSVNDYYTFNNKTWVFNGQGWQLASTGAINGIIIGNATPAAGNFTTLGATGNVSTDQFFLGNGAFLTGINASSNRIFNGNSNVDIATANGNVTIAVNGVDDVVVVSHAANLGALLVNGVYTNERDLGNANVPDGVNSMLIGPVTVNNSSVVGVGNDARLVIL